MKKILKMFSVAFMLCLSAFAFAGCGEEKPKIAMYDVTGYYSSSTAYMSKDTLIANKKNQSKETATAANIFWQAEEGKLSEIVVDKDGNVLAVKILQTEANQNYSISVIGTVTENEISHAFLISDIDHTTFYELTKLKTAPTIIYPTPVV